MRITVTGAAGFIGANLVYRLSEEGHEVTGVDVKSTPWRKHLYMKADRLHLRSDLRDKAKARAAVQGADLVYHLAADHGGAGYFHGPGDMKAAINNLTIDRNMLMAALAAETPRLFFASSACTYPVLVQGKDADPLSESSFGYAPAEALYGEAKRMSTLLFDGARQHGFDFRCGIFHTIYGPSQDYQEPRAKFPTAVCRKMIENPERVEIWGDGTQVRTFLYIDDALDRIQKVAEGGDGYYGPVNIGSDVEVTVQECAEWVAVAAGANPEWVYVDGPVGVAHRSSDNTEWNRRYGEGDLTTPQEGFTRTYGWLSEELNRVKTGVS